MNSMWQMHTDYHTIELISGEVYHYRSGLCDTRNNKGYIVIQQDNVQIPVHKFIFEQFWGYLPGYGQQIDHIDRNIRNNSIMNLRCVTLAQQAQNKGLRKDNKIGCPGVYAVGKHKNRFRAEIQANGIVHRLGTFDTLEEAIDARNRKASQLNKELGTCFNLFPTQSGNSSSTTTINSTWIYSHNGSSSSNNTPSNSMEPEVDIDLTLDSDGNESIIDMDLGTFEPNKYNAEKNQQNVSEEKKYGKYPFSYDLDDDIEAERPAKQQKRKYSWNMENNQAPEGHKKVKYDRTDLRFYFRSRSKE